MISKSLDLDVIPKYADYLNDKGIEAVLGKRLSISHKKKHFQASLKLLITPTYLHLVNGTTGEGMSMSVEERKSVAEKWFPETRRLNITMMVQVGGTSSADVFELVWFY